MLRASGSLQQGVPLFSPENLKHDTPHEGISFPEKSSRPSPRLENRYAIRFIIRDEHLVFLRDYSTEMGVLFADIEEAKLFRSLKTARSIAALLQGFVVRILVDENGQAARLALVPQLVPDKFPAKKERSNTKSIDCEDTGAGPLDVAALSGSTITENEIISICERAGTRYLGQQESFYSRKHGYVESVILFNDSHGSTCGLRKSEFTFVNVVCRLEESEIEWAR